RRGEILVMTMSEIYDRLVHLPNTKNVDARNVLLTKKALALLDLNGHEGDKLIPQSENAFRLMLDGCKEKVGLADIHFHDTRHEVINRFVNNQKLPVEVLANVTGHKNIKVLVNTYYNPDVEDIADMMDA